jgi:gamma-glutamyltranspeptidase
LIVFRDGKPFLASATIGAGLHPDTLQNLVNVLALDMRPQQSGDQPKTQGPYLGVVSTAGSAPEYAKEAVTEGDFADAVLDDLRALGQPVEVIPKPGRQFSTWIGLRIDDGGVMRSGADSYFPAPAEGY